MKLTSIDRDWKEGFTTSDIILATQAVGDPSYIYPYCQNEVDSNILFISSESLTLSQLDELWQEGDLSIGDKVWEGSWGEIVEAVKAYVAQEDE